VGGAERIGLGLVVLEGGRRGEVFVGAYGSVCNLRSQYREVVVGYGAKLGLRQ